MQDLLGCEAAYQLAQSGQTVELIEKECETGGNLNNWYQLFPDRKSAKDLNQHLRQQVNHPNIRLHLNAEPIKINLRGQGDFQVE